MTHEIKIPWTRDARIWMGIVRISESWKPDEPLSSIHALLDQWGLRLRWRATSRSIVIDIKP